MLEGAILFNISLNRTHFKPLLCALHCTLSFLSWGIHSHSYYLKLGFCAVI